MLTREEDIDAHALHKQGWTISAIARHLGRDRKTVRAYLTGRRTAGVRARQGPDGLTPFSDYVRARLTEDPHLWVTTLADELEELGWAGSVFLSRGGDGVQRLLVQAPGGLNSYRGRYEWLVEGDKLVHQMFVRNGTINGIPIKP